MVGNGDKILRSLARQCRKSGFSAGNHGGWICLPEAFDKPHPRDRTRKIGRVVQGWYAVAGLIGRSIERSVRMT